MLRGKVVGFGHSHSNVMGGARASEKGGKRKRTSDSLSDDGITPEMQMLLKKRLAAHGKFVGRTD